MVDVQSSAFHHASVSDDLLIIFQCLREYKTLLTGFRAIASPKHPDFFNEKDLGDFLRKHGMDFSADCLYHLRTAYDQHRRGCINYADFLQQTMDVTRPLE